MGTRADFYVGRGKDAEWIGSIAFDGYPDGHPKDGIIQCDKEDAFRARVATLEALDHWTRPEDGWPWPWEDSGTTDYAYCLFDGKVWASNWGREFFDPLKPEPEDDDRRELEWPNMKAVQRVTLGKRSGLIVVTDKGRGPEIEEAE